MALNAIPRSDYRDIVKPDQKIPNLSLQVHAQEAATIEKITQANPSGTNSEDQSKENSQKDKQASANMLKSAIDNANNKLKFKRTKCEFTLYEDINRVAIKVIDRDTNEVIREIPPEETLELVQKLWEFAGLIVDEKR
ncbi:MAG: flagellar protein FlaG protein [Herbinix sp.]|jgi:flagellar protein FlaG|nr:flagellar protein FlaG protein [Herbinix sp.]